MASCRAHSLPLSHVSCQYHPSTHPLTLARKHITLFSTPDSTSSRKQESGLCFAAPELGPQLQCVPAGSQLCVVSSLTVCVVAEPQPDLQPEQHCLLSL